MQNQIDLRPFPFVPEPVIVGKCRRFPEKAKVQVPGSTRSNILTENTALMNSPGKVRKLVAENSVLVLSRRACCMCHVMKRLLLSLGVNPAVYDLDEDDEKQVMEDLTSMLGSVKSGFPLVFVGGRLLGGLDDLMAAHITGDLIPVLKQAGALWL